MLEAAHRGPLRERAHRARLPHRHLVALAELGRAVTVQAQDLRKRCSTIGTDRAIAGRRGGDLGDTAHAHRMMVAAGEQGLTGRRAQGGGMKAVEAQPIGSQPLRRRRGARATEGACRPETGIVDHHHQHVGCASRRSEGLDGRERRLCILGVIGGEPNMLTCRDRQVSPRNVRHGASFGITD